MGGISTTSLVYASSVGDWVPLDGNLVPLMIPINIVVPGLGVATCSMRFWTVVNILIGLLLWLYQAHGGFRYVIYIVDDDGVYSLFVIFNFPSDLSFAPDLYHTSLSIYNPVIYVYYWSYKSG